MIRQSESFINVNQILTVRVQKMYIYTFEIEKNTTSDSCNSHFIEPFPGMLINA